MVRTEAKEHESEARREAEHRNAGIDTAEAGLLSNSEQDRQEAEHGSKTGDEDRARNGALFWLQGLRLPASEALGRSILRVPTAFEEGLEQNAVKASKYYSDIVPTHINQFCRRNQRA